MDSDVAKVTRTVILEITINPDYMTENDLWDDIEAKLGVVKVADHECDRDPDEWKKYRCQ